MTRSFLQVDDLDQIPGRPAMYLAVGVFDGVHLGHQHLLRQMIEAAGRAGVAAGVLTFFPHPARFIHGLTGRYYLTRLEERVALLGTLGLDLVITHSFDEATRHMRASSFVDRLQRALDLRALWGGNFSLGYQREGTATYLRRLGASQGFSVHEIDDRLEWGGARVSSTRIRDSLAAGDLADVNGCLGRPFSVSGPVVTGARRGRTIGFPTANLAVWPEQALPANGVYAGMMTVGESTYLAATNVGTRPTVNGDHQVTVEAHLLDFDDDLYDQTVSLAFFSRIRAEMKFPSLEALQAQIAQDVATVRARLAAPAGSPGQEGQVPRSSAPDPADAPRPR